jgi:alpha-mannosidase
MFITLLRSPKWPDAHADVGPQHLELSIVPHEGDWRAPEIREAAAEINAPMVALKVAAHEGGARSGSWLSVEPSTVEMGALKRAEDDDRYIVRLVETSGRATVARLHFAFAVDAGETDLLERELADGFRAHGAVIDVPLKSFEIKTISVRPVAPH